MQADGSDQRVVAEPRGGAEPIWAPTWSPNGQQLAYYQGVDPAERLDDRPCTVRTWIIDSDGTDMRRLEPIGDGCDLPVSWSPDGTRLAVLLIDMADPSHPFHLSMITLDGSEPVVTLQDATSGSWQPVAAPLPPPPSLAASPAP
jgi:Tol biopolymer transport system component